MERKYILKAIVDKDTITFDKIYSSHSEALKDAFKFLDKNYEFDINVIDEYKDESRKDINYILSNHDRFIISRI